MGLLLKVCAFMLRDLDLNPTLAYVNNLSMPHLKKVIPSSSFFL